MAKVARRSLDGCERHRAGMHGYSSPLGPHMDDMRASRLFEIDLILVIYKVTEVLQLSRHVSSRRYISLLPLITRPCAPYLVPAFLVSLHILLQ